MIVLAITSGIRFFLTFIMNTNIDLFVLFSRILLGYIIVTSFYKISDKNAEE